MIYFKPFRTVLFISFLLSVSPAIINSSTQFFLGKIVDGLTLQDPKIVQIFLIILLASLIIKQAIQRYSMFFDLKYIEFNLESYLTRITLEKSFNLSLGQLKQEHTGFKQDVLKTGANSMSQFIFMCMYDIAPLIATFLTASIGLLFINLTFIYIVIIFSILYLIISFYLNKRMQGLIQELIKKSIETNKTFVDILQNLFLLKFSGKMKDTSKHLADSQKKKNDYGIKIWFSYGFKQIILDVLLVVYFIISIMYALYLIQSDIMSVGMFIPTIAWIFSVSVSVSQFRMFQRRMLVAQSNIRKMFDMFEQKSDIEMDPQARPVKKFEDNILFEEVNFDYKDGKKSALNKINIEIKKGEKVALVGRSGSGKTTVVSLLLRLYDPNSGSILIDGVDLRSIILEDWHNIIAYVPQEGDLLDVSIKENILFGTKKRVTEKEIDSVLEKAGIKEFIHNLPKGINTFVGEKGVKLSGGQKQRVCIARALIKNAPILMLDEATSSLDSETEAFVNKAIWDMLGDKTGIVIAHRLSTIIDADKIVVMDGGKILGIGTHEELLKKNSYYKKLVNAQNINL